MAKKKILSSIRSAAGTKPAFMRSEGILHDNIPPGPDEVYRRISGDLNDLGISARKKGNDYEMSPVSPPGSYALNPEESPRMIRFFEERIIPEVLQGAIEQYIAKKVGKDWRDPAILDRLRRAIVAQKDDYWKPQHMRSIRYVKGYSVLGYLAYHLPVYFMQTEHILAMLAQKGLLKKHMTILDAGTGPGVVPLAIADFYSRLDTARADVYSIERSEEHIEAFLALREACVPRGGRVSLKPPIRADIRLPDIKGLPEKIDLLIFSNVLNELSDPSMESQAKVVGRLAGRLSPDGMVLIVEPADEENATRMRSLTVAIRDQGLEVAGPCAFLWGSPCTAPRCWSFMTEPAIRPTRVMETLSRCDESFRYVNTDVKYSYALLQRAGSARHSCRLPPGSKFLRLSKLQQHTGKRINAAGVKMSRELGTTKTHVVKICDGTAKTPVYAVLPSYHRTPDNDALVTAPYGTVLELKGILVRYNREHDAYNLLVSRNSRVGPFSCFSKR